METLLRDVRFGARVMLRRPGATAIALLTFSLGIAASTAMFSVIDAVLLRPLPYAEPESIVSVYTTNQAERVRTGTALVPRVPDNARKR